jgi:hypothetical protein
VSHEWKLGDRDNGEFVKVKVICQMTNAKALTKPCYGNVRCPRFMIRVKALVPLLGGVKVCWIVRERERVYLKMNLPATSLKPAFLSHQCLSALSRTTKPW